DGMKEQGAEVTEVRLPGFDDLLAGTRAVDHETKFDLLDYFAANPAASIRSMSDMLARGLYHASLENRFRRIEREPARDTEERRTVLAKQVTLRNAVVRLLDSLRLDALVYPTMKQKPVLIGDPQTGITCQLSAHTGLPALTLPAGYTDDGLPVGVELLGRPFADDRLVSLAFAAERAGPKRRAPATTPPLVRGRAPQPVSFQAVAAGAVTARGTFVYDAPRGELRFDVRVTGAPPDQVQAVVLRESVDGQPGAIRERLVGPAAAAASGVIALHGATRELLLSGRLLLAVLATEGRDASAALRLPGGR
ncbi:MAG TPA: amidase family protein, partial [Gemmatimonadales bacterium]|nr:amidase family protein [Gemmatimonadales bacterium]